jgi:sec-independent protein translocase protein TatB
MFDVGFSEMLVIAVVALIVIGPERLPKVTRTIGHLLGRLNRYVTDVKADINREMEIEELRKFKEQFQDVAQSVENTINTEVDEARQAIDPVAASKEIAAVPPPQPLPDKSPT